jgi:hypothetical protein
MNEIKKIVAPYQGKVERVDRKIVHVTLRTTREDPVYELQEKLTNCGFHCMCYQTGDDTLPQLGVFFEL